LTAIKPSTARAAIEERRYRPQTAITNAAKALLESEDTLPRTRLLRRRQIAMLIAFAAVLLESFRTARP
jgi:hypothetical protein